MGNIDYFKLVEIISIRRKTRETKKNNEFTLHGDPICLFIWFKCFAQKYENENGTNGIAFNTFNC